jgi:hypothetical protein
MANTFCEKINDCKNSDELAVVVPINIKELAI